MLLRALVTSLLALVISTLTVVSPTATEASLTRVTSMRPDSVTGEVSRVRVVHLHRPAATVAATGAGTRAPW